MMRFVVFGCRKCGHILYVENTEDIFQNIGKVSNLDCPSCGEDPEGNWALIGIEKEFPEQKED